MIVGARVIFAEVCMYEAMVGWLVVDSKKEELLQLQVGLKFERSDLKGDGFRE
jgi:hypothetical protein